MKYKNTYVTVGVFAALMAFASMANAQTTVVQTGGDESVGTISEFSPDTIVIRSENAPAPLRYVYRKTTTYVDDAGNPVSMQIVKSGLPVTVHYVTEGGERVASRVVVHRVRHERETSAPVVEEHRTTVVPAAPAPVVEEHKTTTTTTTTK